MLPILPRHRDIVNAMSVFHRNIGDSPMKNVRFVGFIAGMARANNTGVETRCVPSRRRHADPTRKEFTA